jgi:hypothetical protein
MSATTTKTPAKKGGVNSTSETLVLTKEARLVLQAAFIRTGKQKVAAVKVMLPYVHCTVDQVIVAMYANADKNDDELVIDSGARSTMNRALNVAKAWSITKAADLVPVDNHDTVIELLAQIADITPGVLAGYQVPKAQWESARPEYSPVTVRPTPRTKPEDMFEPYEADVRYGCGDKADTLLAIVEGYLEQRVEHDGIEALLWLQQYRNGVVYANSAKRRSTSAHNKRAADARKGDGDGSTDKEKRGARNQGGTSKKKGKGKAEPADEPGARKGKGGKKSAVAGTKPKTANDKPVRELTTQEIIVVLTKRVVDYSVALTQKEAAAWDDMTLAYDKRFRRIPIGKTEREVTKRGTVKRDKQRAAAPVGASAPIEVITAKNVTPIKPVMKPAVAGAVAPFSTTAQINRALLAEQHAGRITAKKRKQILMDVFEGKYTSEAQFRSLIESFGTVAVAAGSR